MHDVTLPCLLNARARSNPADVFLEEVTGRKLTFAEVEHAALLWAEVFRQQGVNPGDTVLTMLPSTTEAVCAWLGLGWMRAIDVGVNVEFHGVFLRDLIADSGAGVMVAHHRYVPQILEAQNGADRRLHTLIVVDGPDDQIAAAAGDIKLLSAGDLLAKATAQQLPFPHHYDIACLIYTSGTTGRAKGVLIPWAQIHATCMGSMDMYERGDAYYSPFPMNHTSGRLPVLFMAYVGGRLVMRERFSAAEFWDDVRRFQCTTTSMPGTIAGMLYARPPQPDDRNNPLRFVSMIPLIPQLDAFRRRFGVEVRTMFNQTELSSPLVSNGTNLVDNRSCGRARSGYQIRLVDEHDEEVPTGETGEMIVRSDRPWELMAGYHGRPDATAEAWRNGWFHTGDLFTCDRDGNFYYVDRRKDSIRRRGENISSVELEAQVNAHPAVLESAAVGVPAELGEEEIKLVILPRPGSVIDPAELIAFLMSRIPRFMVPRYVEIVQELPRTPAMQRVQKVRLREMGVTPQTWDRTAATQPEAHPPRTTGS
ncbi:AMP-binding protein [Roseiarcaceae bacterium H3SJ34-1]|uniref:AMP-binding protein n=1 Tax=Terripilifer ovatus TaxID=3032367 RepID=UPI003AB93FDB|nr:AMP-binding protein [Roseiarcaceae bacterium H3SJ34-1]